MSTGLQPLPPREATEPPSRPPARKPFPSPLQAGIIASAALVLAVIGGGATATIQASPSGGELTTVASSPAALAASAIAACLWLRVAGVPPGLPRHDRPSVWRRMSAVFIDVAMAGVTLGAVAALLPLAVEARAAGAWAWSFQRSSATAVDTVLSLGVVLAVLSGMMLWMAWPSARGRRSVGGYVMGVRLVRVGGAGPSLGWAVLHVFTGFLALCAWPVTLLAGADREGRYWNDRAAGSRVVRVDPAT
ncbi:MAG TPA: RDD family protein [Longimicrobium sp.]|nr:RDD family protein [Longimicrobium sp.]